MARRQLSVSEKTWIVKHMYRHTDEHQFEHLN